MVMTARQVAFFSKKIEHILENHTKMHEMFARVTNHRLKEQYDDGDPKLLTCIDEYTQGASDLMELARIANLEGDVEALAIKIATDASYNYA